MLDTDTSKALDFVFDIRSWYLARMSVTSCLSAPLSQSLPPATSTAWANLVFCGKASTAPWMSLIAPPLMHSHLVPTSLFTSISRMMLVSNKSVPWGLRKFCNWDSDFSVCMAAMRSRRVVFSSVSFRYARSLVLASVSYWFLREDTLRVNDCSISVRVDTSLMSVLIWVGITLHLKQGHTPGGHSSRSLIQSMCTQVAHKQHRTISRLSWCPW